MKLARIDITTGASDDSYTEVKGDSIFEGEKILVGMKGGAGEKSPAEHETAKIVNKKALV